MTQIPSLLDILTNAWNQAKAAEKKANEERIGIEAEILESSNSKTAPPRWKRA